MIGHAYYLCHKRYFTIVFKRENQIQEFLIYLRTNNINILQFACLTNYLTCNPRPATCDLQLTTRDLQPATCDLQPATCNLRPATCDLQPATCKPRPATCNLRPATCKLDPPSNSLRSNERKSFSSYRFIKQTGPQVWEDRKRTQALLMEIVYKKY